MRVLGFLLALCALVAAGCGGGSAMEEAVPPAETAPPTEARSDRPAAPSVEGETLDGKRISLADFRGKPVFVNVWSSW
jgi:cytochrome oxidase Cu insertion factor (SCO1/SenC/PrrC family)